MDAVLIQYKGGGYDGCFWEWNYAAIIDDEFHNIASTGRKGCETREQLEDFIANAHVSPYSRDFYIYDIPEDLEEFAKEAAAPHVRGVAKYLAEFDIIIMGKCVVCGGEFPAADEEELLFGNYKGMGGVVYTPVDFICWECYTTPTEKEIDDAVSNMSNGRGGLMDILCDSYQELWDIDTPIELYEKMVHGLIIKAQFPAGGGWWEKENGDYVYYSMTVGELMNEHFSENMPEFIALFCGQRQLPEDIVMRNAGYVELPGMQEV